MNGKYYPEFEQLTTRGNKKNQQTALVETENITKSSNFPHDNSVRPAEINREESKYKSLIITTKSDYLDFTSLGH